MLFRIGNQKLPLTTNFGRRTALHGLIRVDTLLLFVRVEELWAVDGHAMELWRDVTQRATAVHGAGVPDERLGDRRAALVSDSSGKSWCFH